MNIFKNKIIIYLASRYFTYALQFVLALIIAAKLGPFYLGVYGVVQLILSYFDQINFGIPHSLNVLLVHNKDNNRYQNELTLNSLAIFSYVCLVIIALGLYALLAGYTTFGEYYIRDYMIPIVLVAVLSYYNSIFTTVARFRNQLGLLSITGTLPVFLNLCVLFVFHEENLVNALVLSNLLSCIISAILFYFGKSFPKICLREIKIKTQRKILKKGIYLFLYNSCFYFILIVVRTIISRNYSVEEFGFFTFSFTIANAVMLLLNSLNTIIFPKTIDVLSNNDKTEIKVVLGKLRIGYVTTSHMLIYLAMIFFPVLLLFFPQYKPALQSMNMIALAVLMNANSYGYSTLLIAQNKEKLSSIVSVIALLISIVFGLVIVKIFEAPFSLVIFSVMFAYLAFSYLVAYFGDKILYGTYSHVTTLKNFFPIRLLLPYMTALIIAIVNKEALIGLAFILFLILNIKDLSFLKGLAQKLIRNPNIIDL